MITITQEQLEKDSLALAEKIKKSKKKFNYVFGIPRGGEIPAQIIAKELSIPAYKMEEIRNFQNNNLSLVIRDTRILIVDDLIDSGKTLLSISGNLASFPIGTAVLYKKKNAKQLLKPDFVLKEVPRQWMCLPHEEGLGVEDHITRILEFIGEDPTREGLKDTPRRVAKMYTEIFRGYDPDQKPKITTFPNGKDGITYNQMILDEGTFYSHCLTGDTQIKTARGIFRIKDLVGRVEDVFCYDEKNKRFTISKAKDIRMTSKKAEVLKLTTDYGVIYATSEHKFLTYNRGWVMLKDLKPKDSLVALNSRLYDNYLQIQVSNSREGWKKEHNFIYEEISGEKLKSKELVHHIDGDKRNNIYENLQKMINKDHTGLHARKYMASLSSEQKSEIGKRANWGFISLRENEPEKYKLVKAKAKESLKKMYSSERGIALKEKKSRDTKIWWKNRKEKKMKNHRVVKVEFYGYESVYNMEVEKFHNFVANGLVVHNCEHHMVPFFGRYYFAYIPNKTILGLSKVARIVDYYSARLQVQERLVKQIVDEIERACKPQGIALIMKAEHLCYDKNTEILTDKGWKLFKDLRKEDIVAQYTKEDKEISFVKPISYQEFIYRGKMIRVDDQKNDFLVTPDHRCLVKTDWGSRKERKYKFILAKDLAVGSIIPKAGVLKNSNTSKVKVGKLEFDRKTFCAFMGAFLSEGYAKLTSEGKGNITIVQFDKSKGYKDFKELLLNRFELHFTELRYEKKLNRNRFRAYSKEFTLYLSKFGKSGDKFIPNEIFESCLEDRKEFLKFYFLGDGCINNNGKSRQYTTKSKRMAEDLQRLLLLSGVSSSISKRKSGYYDVFEHLSLKESKDYARIYNISLEEYSGKVYCVSVPSEAIVTRRNGKVLVSGNCKTMRGVKKQGVMTASEMRGSFAKESKVRQEFLSLIDL